MSPPSRDALVWQLKMALRNVYPPIWRELLVPGYRSLRSLHGIIQVAFDWDDAYLHLFGSRGQIYLFDDDETGFAEETTITLADLSLGEGDRFYYVYDLADMWELDIRVECIVEAESIFVYPLCIGGQRAAPPEDSGGPVGYANLLEVLRDPHHQCHAEMMEWLDSPFDPEAFDINAINKEIMQTYH